MYWCMFFCLTCFLKVFGSKKWASWRGRPSIIRRPYSGLAYFSLFQKICIFINFGSILTPILASFFVILRAWTWFLVVFFGGQKIDEKSKSADRAGGTLDLARTPTETPMYAREYLTITWNRWGLRVIHWRLGWKFGVLGLLLKAWKKNRRKN